jgi:signal transduction histidine kinase
VIDLRERAARTIDLRDVSALADPDRLAELRATGLMDSPPEEPFDRITRLAERLLDVPVALITLVDRDRQFFKSHVGLTGELGAVRGSPLTHSLCQYAVTSRAPVVIADVRESVLVESNPAVAEQGVVAYAGEPLETSGGHVLGALCIISDAPREWQPDELQLLSELAALAVTEIEYRLRTRSLRELEVLSVALAEPLAQLGEAVRSMVAVADGADDPLVGRLATAASIRLGWVEAAAGDLAGSLRWGPVDTTTVFGGLGRRVERAVQIARHSVVDRDIELHLDRGSMPVECDPHALDRAVSNVLVSVMQHADAGQPVEVRLVHEEEVARLYVRCDGSAVPVSELARMVSQLSGAACRPAGDAGTAGASLRVTGRVTTARNGPVEGCTGPHGTTLSVAFVLARADGQRASTPAARSAPASTFIAP